jgi:hypothetical protein
MNGGIMENLGVCSRRTVIEAKKRCEQYEMRNLIRDMNEYYHPLYLDEARQTLEEYLLNMTPDKLISFAIDIANCKND